MVAYVYQKEIVSSDNNTNAPRITRVYSIEGLENLPAEPLRQFLESMQSRPASKIDIKYQRVMEYFMRNDLDVLFVQEGNQV